MAEAFYNSLRGQAGMAISAGIADVGARYNFRPTREIVAVMLECDLDVSGQRVKQINADMVEQAQRVVVLCEPEICPDYLLDNPRVSFRSIRDPFGRDVAGTRIIRDEIRSLVLELT